MKNIIQTERLHYRPDDLPEERPDILQGIDLEIAENEVVSIVGPSGAGKTTLLQIIGTLGKQDSGVVVIDGIETHTLVKNQLARFRNRHIGFVFQFHQLLPEFNAVENV